MVGYMLWVLTSAVALKQNVMHLIRQTRLTISVGNKCICIGRNQIEINIGFKVRS